MFWISFIILLSSSSCLSKFEEACFDACLPAHIKDGAPVQKSFSSILFKLHDWALARGQDIAESAQMKQYSSSLDVRRGNRTRGANYISHELHTSPAQRQI